MKLKHLEKLLENLEGFSNPSPLLEQYRTPAPLAARLLFHAAMRGDIEGKRVCDLGCGTGVLGIGAALLGARDVVAVEVDPDVLGIARKNSLKAGVEIQFIEADVKQPEIHAVAGWCDTVVMNPPFGAQQLHADRPFLDAAVTIAPVTYGIFNAGSRSFISSYLAGRGEIDEVIGGLLPIRRTFAFHRDEVREIPVEICRIVSHHEA
ncbi:MAG: methyltransferase [Methanoregulaceae archaeon]|nr:methyltransferase [Methanoregulaceae archaeon]NLH26103.1 methyltransferase [Methanomicrobiales archaeon]HNO08645.1 METTL5 family protein [Methanoregulaceae archaeon]HOU80579.1 METTL5 family protein [Methanoregulaceae archaeon]